MMQNGAVESSEAGAAGAQSLLLHDLGGGLRGGRSEKFVNSWGPSASSKKNPDFFDFLIPLDHF